MAELKTKRTRSSVAGFIESVENKRRREDAFVLLDVFRQLTGFEPALWGDSIIGFGEYHYESDRSQQKGDWPLTGFSPRKRNLTIYIMPGFSNYQDLLGQLGKHKTSVSCIYINKLDDIDLNILKQIVSQSVDEMKSLYRWKS